MSTTEIKNAIVDYIHLGREDHGIMTAYVGVKGDGWGCGFGGYALDSWDESKKRRVGVDFGMEFIIQVLVVLEVDQWEKLPGTPLRVETEGWGGKITRIGHYLKDNWFDPKALADEMLKESGVAEMTHAEARHHHREQETRGFWKTLKLAFILVLILGCIIAVEGCSSGGGKFPPSSSSSSSTSPTANLSHPSVALSTTPRVELMGDQQAQEITAYANSQGNPLWHCSTCQANQLSTQVLAEVPQVLAMQPRPDLVIVQTGAFDGGILTSRTQPTFENLLAIQSAFQSAGIPVAISNLPESSAFDPYYLDLGLEIETEAGVIGDLFIFNSASEDLTSGVDYTQAGLEVIYPLIQTEVEQVRVDGKPVGGRK